MWNIYNPLITKFGDEYTVLMDAPQEEMAKIVNPKVAEAVVRVREEKAKVIPGYDGVYGQLVMFEDKDEAVHQKPKQRSMSDLAR